LPLDEADVVIRDNRIAAVGPTGSVDVPSDTRVIDVSGHTLLPGFVDVHDHPDHDFETLLEQKWHYLANLAYGMTTSLDPSARSVDVFAEAELVALGEMDGPRIYSTGNAFYGGGARPQAVIENLEDARHHVRRLKAWGTHYLKQYMQPRREQRQWVMQAAREEGINTTAEGGGDFKMDLSMALDGYTGFEHSLPYTPIRRDVIQLFAQSGINYTPTLVVAYGGPGALEYFYQHLDTHEDPKVRRFLPHGWLDRVSRRRVLIPENEYDFVQTAAGAAKVLEAGGHIGLGAHGNHPGLGVHFELWSFALGGMTPMQALRTATRGSAEVLGLGQDLGTVEAGKLADFVIMRGNPLEDIRKSTDIAYVVANGKIFDADTMDEVWPKAKPRGTPWPLAPRNGRR
jgi:imidazolonepropionase-like amidohydrolase